MEGEREKEEEKGGEAAGEAYVEKRRRHDAGELTKGGAGAEEERYAAHTVPGYGNPEDEVSLTFDVPESVRATVEEGQVVGTATVWLDGYEVGKVDLVTHRAYVSDFYTDGVATLMLLPALLAILLALALVTVLTGGGPGLFRRRHRRGSHGSRRR